jgi:hypothetical protein
VETNNEKPSRAQLMAAEYGKKLEEISGVKLEAQKIINDGTETLEMRIKRKLALEKLATFRDLLG